MGAPEIQNRKATHDYSISAKVETGIQLTGTEVKSLRQGKGNLSEAYAQIQDNEVWLHHFHISPYEAGNRENPEPLRPRKLLLHKEEIRQLRGDVEQKGKSLIPLKGYFKKQTFKILLGVGTGKTKGDKRQDLIKRDTERQIQRVLRSRNR